MTVLETPRLILRHWREDDLPAFTAMNADPSVMKYFPSPLTAEASEAMFKLIGDKLRHEGFGAWAVDRREDGLFLGFTGLHRVTFPGKLNGCIEIAWRMRHEAWGNGYAPEAAAACLKHAAQLGIEQVYAFTTLSNLRSQRVMQKCGMERLEEFDHPALPAGHPLLRHILYVAHMA